MSTRTTMGITDKNVELLRVWSEEAKRDLVQDYNNLTIRIKLEKKDFSEIQARNLAFDLIKNQRMAAKMITTKATMKSKAVSLEGYIIADTGLVDQCDSLKRYATKLFATEKDTALAQGVCFDDGRVRDYREEVYSFGKKVANPNFGKELKPEWKRQLWFVVKYQDEYRPATMTLYREQVDEVPELKVPSFVSFRAVIKDEASPEMKLNYSKGSGFEETEEHWSVSLEQIMTTSPYFTIYEIDQVRKVIIDAYKAMQGTGKKYLNVTYWVKGTVYIPQNWSNVYDQERDRASRLLLPSDKDINQVALEDQISMNIPPRILGKIGPNSQVLVFGKFSYKEATPQQLAQGNIDKVYMDVYGMHPTLKIEEGEAIKYSDILEKIHFSF